MSTPIITTEVIDAGRAASISGYAGRKALDATRLSGGMTQKIISRTGVAGSVAVAGLRFYKGLERDDNGMMAGAVTGAACGIAGAQSGAALGAAIGAPGGPLAIATGIVGGIAGGTIGYLGCSIGTEAFVNEYFPSQTTIHRPQDNEAIRELLRTVPSLADANLEGDKIPNVDGGDLLNGFMQRTWEFEQSIGELAKTSQAIGEIEHSAVVSILSRDNLEYAKLWDDWSIAYNDGDETRLDAIQKQLSKIELATLESGELQDEIEEFHSDDNYYAQALDRYDDAVEKVSDTRSAIEGYIDVNSRELAAIDKNQARIAVADALNISIEPPLNEALAKNSNSIVFNAAAIGNNIEPPVSPSLKDKTLPEAKIMSMN